MARSVSLILIALTIAGMVHAGDEPMVDAREFDAHIRPLLVSHCATCHSGEKPKGKLRLDRLSSDLADTATREHWAEVVDRLKSGEMPPEGKPRPTEKDLQAFLDWLAPRVAAAETAARAAQGRVVLRRLNRVEYENTMRDLLGINVKLKDQLPEDGSADGFDNVGAANHTSSFLMEKYLEAADTALNLAIANRPKPPAFDDETLEHQGRTPGQGERRERLSLPGRRRVVCFCSSEWHSVGATQFYPPEGGNYRFRISASAYQSDGKPVTFRVTATGTQLTGKSGLVGYFDAPADGPTVFEVDRYMEPHTTITILPYGLANSSTVHKIGADKCNGPGLAIQWVEVEGPLNDLAAGEPSPPLRRPAAEARPAELRRPRGGRLGPAAGRRRTHPHAFARRAFRRAVTADDVTPFLALVKAKLADGYTFEQAIRAALKGVLVSPDFLFLRETPGKLDDFALASRLSYFLWSTMPDDELLALAEQKKLSDPDVLRRQVERMLGDPKAAAFTENFVGQWLGLRDIDATEPSHILYPGVRRHAQGVDDPRDGAVLRRGAEERPEPDELRRLRLHDAQRPAGEALRHPRRGRLGVPQGAAAAGQPPRRRADDGRAC